MASHYIVLFTAILIGCILVSLLDVGNEIHRAKNRIAQLELQVAAQSCSCSGNSGQSTTNTETYQQSELQSNVYYDNSDTVYIDYYGRMPPSSIALSVIGTQHVRGRVIVDGCVIINIDGNHVDLCSVVKTIQSFYPACTGDCVHGIMYQNGSCTCVCFDGWTGSTCEASTCSLRGTWDPVNETCTCQTGFDSRYDCAVPDCGIHGQLTSQNGGWIGGIGHTLAPDADTGTCICDEGYTGASCNVTDFLCDGDCMGACLPNGQCACDEFQFGTNCENNCSAAGIQNSECSFVTRTNLGLDRCYVYDDTTICVCGGGYNLLTDRIDTRVGMCQNCAPEDMSMDICCAPDSSLCSLPELCSTASCCAQQSSTESCFAMGCTSCNITDTIQTCSLSAIVGYNCTARNSPAVFWDSAPVDCDKQANAAICSSISRNMYRQIYKTATSLASARVQVNSAEWSHLHTVYSADLERTFKLSTSISTLPCYTTNTIGSSRILGATGVSVLAVTCGTPLVFWLSNGIPESLTAAEGINMLFYDVDGILKCVAAPISDDSIFYTFTQDTLLPVDRLQAIGIPYDSSFNQCALIEIVDQSYFVVSGYTLSMDVDSELFWCSGSSCPPLYVFI